MSVAGRLAALDRAATSALTRTMGAPVAGAGVPGFTVHEGRARGVPGRDPRAPVVHAALCRLIARSDRAGPPPVFFDIETTGLGRAAVPFLVGLAGFGADDTAWVRQWQLADLADERAMWLAVRDAFAALPPGAPMITYNGASFDRTVVRLRLRRLGLWDDDLARRFDADHLDVLPICRRLWRGTLGDCRLLTLERDVLGAERIGDPSGLEIAELGQRWLDDPRDPQLAAALAAVRRHNADDLLGLASLVIACADVLEAPRSLAQALGALRHLRRVGATATDDGARRDPLGGLHGIVASWRAAAVVDAVHGVDFLLLGATMLRALGQHDQAHGLLQEICAQHPGHAVAATRLAIDCEHRLARPDLALDWLGTVDDPCPRRIARLRRKWQQGGEAPPRDHPGPPPPTSPQAPAPSSPDVRRTPVGVPGSWRVGPQAVARRARVV